MTIVEANRLEADVNGQGYSIQASQSRSFVDAALTEPLSVVSVAGHVSPVRTGVLAELCNDIEDLVGRSSGSYHFFITSVAFNNDSDSPTNASAKVYGAALKGVATIRRNAPVQFVETKHVEGWPSAMLFKRILSIKEMKILISGVSKFLSSGKIDFVNSQLCSLNPYAMGNDSIVALVRVTYPARNELSGWPAFLKKANTVLLSRGAKPQVFS